MKSLAGCFSCTEDTASDYIELSNFMTEDRKYHRYCGDIWPENIESDGDFFKILFNSNDKFDATGFMAEYQFIKKDHRFLIKKIPEIPSNSVRIHTPQGKSQDFEVSG